MRAITVITAAMAIALSTMLAGCSAAPAPTPDDRADAVLFVQARLDSAWSGDSRLSRPSPVAPKFYLPNGWGFKVAECMVAAGFVDFRYGLPDGFTNQGKPVSEVGQEGLARYTCILEYPTYDTRYSEPGPDDLDLLYDYYVERLVPCLALEGVPVRDVPSREQFADGGEGQPGWWNPYLAAELPASANVAAALVDGCAPYPEGFVASA